MQETGRESTHQKERTGYYKINCNPCYKRKDDWLQGGSQELHSVCGEWGARAMTGNYCRNVAHVPTSGIKKVSDFFSVSERLQDIC
jgi:hypothetical protein